MDYIFLVGLSVIISMIGIGLFRLAAAELRERRQELNEQSTENVVILPGAGKLSEKPFMVCMIIFNLFIGLFSSMYYGRPVLNVANDIILCTILWVCAWSDWTRQLILNQVLMIGLLGRLATLALQVLTDIDAVVFLLLNALVAVAALLIISVLCRLVVPKSVGYGDIKLLGLMGFYLGVDGVWNVMLCTMILTFFVSVYLIAFKKKSRKAEMAFAPFLLAGTLTAIILTGV